MNFALSIRPAGGLLAWILRRQDFRAITLPWAIYVLPLAMGDARLIAHERVHEDQMRRDGVLRFCAQYIWWSLRHGHWMNPYEIEARERSGSA